MICHDKRFHRMRAECADCESSVSCRGLAVSECYGQYDESDICCRNCPNRGYCAAAKDPSSCGVPLFEESVSDEKPEHSESVYREIAIRLLEACNHNALTVAIAVSRLGGMNFRKIGAALGVKEDRVRKIVRSKILNPELRRILFMRQGIPVIGEQSKRKRRAMKRVR